MSRTLILGTRGSRLAVAQSSLVAAAVTKATGVPVTLQIVKTRGDRDQHTPLAALGGKGLFTLELEDGLRAGRRGSVVQPSTSLSPTPLCRSS